MLPNNSSSYAFRHNFLDRASDEFDTAPFDTRLLNVIQSTRGVRRRRKMTFVGDGGEVVGLRIHTVS